MSDQDDLTPRQREDLHEELQRLREELVTLIEDGAGLTETVTLDQARVGRISRIDAIQQQAMAQATVRRHKERLIRVEAAMERYTDDPESFGYCAACGEFIGHRRLKAFPESVFCVPCREARGG